MTGTALATITALPPVTLDELNERAELQTRVDRKYMLPLADLAEVLTDLDDDTRVLELEAVAAEPHETHTAIGIPSGIRSAAYESVYFDTPGLVAFHLAARGRRRRFKVRTRSYLDSGATFLEVKTRGGRSLTVKDRLEYDPADHDRLTAEGLAYTSCVLSESGVAEGEWATLTPTLITRYRRTTLLLPARAGRDESRATIDVDLEWIDEGAGLFPRRLRTPASVIVETKSGRATGSLDRALWRHGHRPATVSKFGTGLAALRPDLPSNKWTRVLRRHFTAAAPHDQNPTLQTIQTIPTSASDAA
ncbi:polyphosphate polymerase domain-containing protein [Leifsonia sp. YIM 134122]|uniref:Polyphosphate polymerase domain-containing protein n=1 Tax=Leifsonia stereocauli TaxID=3134136 RepID=A0ABU9W7H3_9MICO